MANSDKTQLAIWILGAVGAIALFDFVLFGPVSYFFVHWMAWWSQ